MLNNYDKNRRIYPVYISPDIGGKGPVKDGWESLNGEAVGPVRQLSDGKLIDRPQKKHPTGTAWPDGGINASSSIVFPREEDEDSTIPRTKRIHDFTLEEDPEVENDGDDQNDFGGLAALLAGMSPDDAEAFADAVRFGEDVESNVEETKYGPGNYPSEPEFFHNLFAEGKLKYTWIVPGVLAAGAHPIFTLHQDDLSEFKKAGFKAIVSVCDRPLDAKYLDGFNYLFIPTPKGTIDKLDKICRFIDGQEAKGNAVYVHSIDGKGRAAAVLAAYLIHMDYLTAEEAIEYVKQHYKSSMTTEQEKKIFENI